MSKEEEEKNESNGGGDADCEHPARPLHGHCSDDGPGQVSGVGIPRSRRSVSLLLEKERLFSPSFLGIIIPGIRACAHLLISCDFLRVLACVLLPCIYRYRGMEN